MCPLSTDAPPCQPDGTADIPESPALAAPDDSHYHDLLVTHYAAVMGIVRAASRRYRLTHDEADEFASSVRLRLVENHYAVFRKFKGQSSLHTYLTRVVERICLDARLSRLGRWRPSSRARQLGATAIRLERLVVRDRLPLDEACQILRTNFRVPESVADLERICAMFPPRLRLRRAEGVAVDQIPSRATGLDVAAASAWPPEVRQRLALAISSLPPVERRMIALRFTKGWTVVRIARTLSVEHKALYRDFKRIYRALRASVADDHAGRPATSRSSRVPGRPSSCRSRC
jgi:RNA polymerase sigma factor (sigma-70 family)